MGELGEDEATVARKRARGVTLALRRLQQGHSSDTRTFYNRLHTRMVS